MQKQLISSEQIAQIVLRCLRDGKCVEIENLGRFRPSGDGSYSFDPPKTPRVFLAHVDEDSATVLRLYEKLKAAGLNPWIDKKKLLAGQNWPRAIEQAIRTCDFFVPCFSKRAMAKRGRFNSELRLGIECAELQPLEMPFIVPVRLELTEVPAKIAESIHYVDLFPNFDRGVSRLIKAIEIAGRQKPR